jgi:hypothetical protein
MSYIYLASPYSHPNALVQEMRYVAARDAVAWLLKRCIWVYSPIVHCHHLALHESLPKGYAFWRPYNRAMLEAATALYILDIVGASTSEGVAGEHTHAQKLNLPITAMKPSNDRDGYDFDPPLNSLEIIQ